MASLPVGKQNPLAKHRHSGLDGNTGLVLGSETQGSEGTACQQGAEVPLMWL